MKTIIARFTEMKKSPNSIIEVEGETVDVNKVETALRSAGVAARDASGQFRDVDDVLLELSSKWDSLDVMTQRYIATTAAGSRQQSRFIAMMSNYQRTLELTSYAQNSAGASQKQFEKTTESLESKLNKLHNAWEQLITGIGNQTAIKGVVDLLTGLITTINNVTSAIDPLKTGWSKLLTVILGFKAAKGIANSALQNIGAALSKGKDGKAVTFGEKVGRKLSGTERKKPVQQESAKKEYTEAKQHRKEVEQARKATEKYRKERQKSLDILNKEIQKEERELELLEEETKVCREKKDLQPGTGKKQVGRKQYWEEKAQDVEKRKKPLENSIKSKKNEASNIEKDLSHLSKEEELRKRVTVATDQEVAAKGTLLKSSKMGLLTSTRYNLQLIFGTKKAKEKARAELLEAGAITAEGKATDKATISQWALNASMLACPIMWIVAGIAAIVAAVAIFNAIYETAEERSEKLKKATEQLGTQMNETQQSISDLKDSWENLKSLKSELDNLTVGTSEWKSKLIEVNQEVLNLIDKYPQLAQYVSTSKNGEMNINASGYQNFLDSQERTLLRQQQAYSFNQAVQSKMNEKALEESMSSVDSTQIKKDFLKISEKDIAANNFFSTGISSLTDELAEGQKKINNTLGDSEKILIKTALSNKENYKEFEKMRDSTEANTKKYAELTGLTEEQVKKKKEEGELDDDAIKTLIATNEYFEKFSKKAEELLKQIRTGGAAGTEKGKREISGPGSLTKQDIIDLNRGEHGSNIKKLNKYAKNGQITIEEDKEEEAKQLYLDLTGHPESYLNDLLKISSIDDLLQNIYTSNVNKEQIEKNTGSFNNKEKTFYSKILNEISKKTGEPVSSAEEEQISGIFSQISGQGGDLEKFSTYLKDIMSKFKNKDDLKKFLETLGETDFSSETKVRAFSDSLKDFGITLGEKVKKQLVNATNAANDFSLTNVVDELRNAEASKIANEHINENNRTFSESDYKTLVEQIEKTGLTGYKDKFTRRGTDWVYRGNLNELRDVVSGDKSLENTKADYEEAVKDRQEKQKTLQEKRGTLEGDIGEIKEQEKKDAPKFWKTILEDNSGAANAFKKLIPEETIEEMASGTVDDSSLLKTLLYKQDEEGNFTKDLNFEQISSILELIQSDKKYADLVPTDFFNTLKNNADIINKIAEGGTLNNIMGTGVSAPERTTAVENAKIIKDLLASNNYEGMGKSDSSASTAKKKLLGEYQKAGLIDDKTAQEWAQLTAEQLKEKIKKIDVSKLSDDELETLTETEKTMFSDKQTAREILEYEPKTGAGFVAQQQAIESIVKSYKGWEMEIANVKAQNKDFTNDQAYQYVALKHEVNSALSDITKKMSTYKDILSPENINSKKGTTAYNEAITDLTASAKKAFGDKVNTNWVEKNIDDLRKWVSGGKDAEAAFQRLVHTAEVSWPTILTGKTGDAKGKKIDKFNELTSDIADLNEELKTIDTASALKDQAKNFTTYKKTITDALSAIDKSDASIEVKNNSRAAIAEFIKDSLTVLAAKYAIADDENTKVSILTAANDLMNLANSNGFSVSGINLSGAKTIEYTGVNGEKVKDTYINSKKATFTAGDVNVSDTKAKGKNKTKASGSSDAGGNKTTTDFDAALVQRKATYNATYNILKQITALEKEREKLATRLNRLLEEQKRTQNYNLQAIRQNQAAQVANLRQQIGANQSIIATSNALAASMAARTNGLSYNSATHSVQINPGVIGSMTDDEYSKFQSIISMVEGFASNAQTAADKITTAENNIYELTKAVIITEDTQFNNLQKLAVLEREREEHQRRMDKLTKKLHLSEQEYTKEKNKQIKVLKNEVALNNRIKKEKSADLERLNRQTAKNGWGSRLYYNQETGQIVNDVAWFKSQNLNNDEYAIYQDILNNMQQGADVINNAKNSIKTAEDALDDLTQGLQDFKDNLQNFDVSKKIIDQTISLLDKEKNRLKRRDSLVTPTQILNNIQGLNSARNDKNTTLKNENTAIKKNIKEEILSDSMVKKYLKYDSKTNYFTINRSAYDAITDKTIKDYVDKFFQKGNEYADRINANLLTIEENKDANYDELEAYRQEGIKFDEKVYNAVVKMKEEEVSALNNIDTSIKDAASNLISSIQKNIQKIRQDRQNDKTAKDLQDMEAKLAYLQVDTSNANQKSILDTKKTLEDKQQSYTDTLIDQKITELQRQNDEAAKQRKKQIDIMQAQLELDKKNNVIWDYVDKIKRQGVDTTGRIKTNSELYNLLSKIDNATEKNAMQLKDWLSELQYGYSSGQAYARASSSNTSTKSKKSTKVKAYASGGLVDSTGVAWLDGTKTSPEMVLNSQDTKNFIQLKDILANLKNNKIQTNEGNSNFNFEISIEVDKISSDYDVDKLVNRIKQQITNEARYRNVNTINMIR